MRTVWTILVFAADGRRLRRFEFHGSQRAAMAAAYDATERAAGADCRIIRH